MIADPSMMNPSACSTPAAASTAPPAATAAVARQYLSFTLGDERYAVDILNVQEIRRFESVTFVPDAPACIKGVINLRGVIVPVMDLRLKLGMAAVDYDHFTVMIVLTIGPRVIGIVVDTVCDVIELDPHHILPPPEFSGAMDSRVISGISTVDGHMVIVLDSQHLTESSTPMAIDALPE